MMRPHIVFNSFFVGTLHAASVLWFLIVMQRNGVTKHLGGIHLCKLRYVSEIIRTESSSTRLRYAG